MVDTVGACAVYMSFCVAAGVVALHSGCCLPAMPPVHTSDLQFPAVCRQCTAQETLCAFAFPHKHKQTKDCAQQQGEQGAHGTSTMNEAERRLVTLLGHFQVAPVAGAGAKVGGGGRVWAGSCVCLQAVGGVV